MKSRMEKYQNTSSKKSSVKRTNKNQDLYNDFYTNTRYTNLDHYEDDHVIDFYSSSNNMGKREDYQKVKEYKELLPTKEVKTKEDLRKYLEEDHKVYDINRIIATAKQNRKEQEEEQERKRKLRNNSYNIFEGTTLEELKERRKKIEEEKEKIDEMINTISSEQLRQDIDTELEKELFSDLMPTQTKKEVLADEVRQLMKETEDIEEKKEPTLQDIDRSFYTKSMDLSDADFEMDDELEQELNKNHTFLKILLILILFAVVGVAIYLLMTRK